ncbi:MAG: hypothetical protein ABIP79_05640 [Chitinophagaceae bacterium]
MKMIVKPKTKKQEKAVKEFLANLDKSVDFVSNYKTGKTNAKSFLQLLDELQ